MTEQIEHREVQVSPYGHVGMMAVKALDVETDGVPKYVQRLEGDIEGMRIEQEVSRPVDVLDAVKAALLDSASEIKNDADLPTDPEAFGVVAVDFRVGDLATITIEVSDE